MLEVVLRELERIFLKDSGLAEARPGVRVAVSRPAHYLELLENIQVHGYHRMRGLGRVLENAEIRGGRAAARAAGPLYPSARFLRLSGVIQIEGGSR